MSDTSRSETTGKTAGSDLLKVPHSEGRKDAGLWKLPRKADEGGRS